MSIKILIKRVDLESQRVLEGAWLKNIALQIEAFQLIPAASLHTNMKLKESIYAIVNMPIAVSCKNRIHSYKCPILCSRFTKSLSK